MTLTPMDSDQLAELLDVIGEYTKPAAPELVLDAVRAEQAARRYPPTNVATVRLGERRALDALPAIARRLVNAETALATLRHLLADLVADLDDGDELTTDDVLHRLAAADMRLNDEIAQACALHAAHAAAQL